jgi:hypothetical protein
MSIKLSFKKGDPPRIYSTPFSLLRGAKEKNIYNSSKNKLL